MPLPYFQLQIKLLHAGFPLVEFFEELSNSSPLYSHTSNSCEIGIEFPGSIQEFPQDLRHALKAARQHNQQWLVLDVTIRTPEGRQILFQLKTTHPSRYQGQVERAEIDLVVAGTEHHGAVTFVNHLAGRLGWQWIIPNAPIVNTAQTMDDGLICVIDLRGFTEWSFRESVNDGDVAECCRQLRMALAPLPPHQYVKGTGDGFIYLWDVQAAAEAFSSALHSGFEEARSRWARAASQRGYPDRFGVGLTRSPLHGVMLDARPDYFSKYLNLASRLAGHKKHASYIVDESAHSLLHDWNLAPHILQDREIAGIPSGRSIYAPMEIL